MVRKDCDCEKVSMAVFGEKPDHSDALVGVVNMHGIILFGTPDNPGGIAKDVRTIKRWVGLAGSAVTICGVLLVVIEFLAKVLPVLRGMAE